MGVFEALGDPVRRRILELLIGAERPAGEFAPLLGISQPAVSQQLKILREAGLVQARAQGTRRLYALAPAGVDAAQAWLAQLSPFTQALDALATEVARGKKRRSQQEADGGRVQSAEPAFHLVQERFQS